MNVDIDSLPLQDLYSIIQDNPGLLRRPIILDDKRLQVGYNEDEIRRFLPRKYVRSNYKKRNVWLINNNINNFLERYLRSGIEFLLISFFHFGNEESC